MFGGLLRATVDVLSSQIGTENMSDALLDQSSHHSRSVRKDKMQTVTSGSLAAAASAKAQNPLRHLCYLCHQIISFVCFSAMIPSLLSVSFFYDKLQLERWIRDRWTLVRVSPTGRDKVSRKQDVRALMWIYSGIAFALPNKIRPEVAWDRKQLLQTE